MSTKKKKEEEKLNPDGYAVVRWLPDDIKSRRPRWSLSKCEEWLSDHESAIEDIMIERGWNYIENQLD